MNIIFTKDPNAILDYRVDWTAWLGEDTIEDSIWYGFNEPEEPPDEDELVLEDESFDATSTTIWVSGGKKDTTYPLINHIVTAAGRQDDRTIGIQIVEK